MSTTEKGFIDENRVFLQPKLENLLAWIDPQSELGKDFRLPRGANREEAIRFYNEVLPEIKVGIYFDGEKCFNGVVLMGSTLTIDVTPNTLRQGVKSSTPPFPCTRHGGPLEKSFVPVTDLTLEKAQGGINKAYLDKGYPYCVAHQSGYYYLTLGEGGRGDAEFISYTSRDQIATPDNTIIGLAGINNVYTNSKVLGPTIPLALFTPTLTSSIDDTQLTGRVQLALAAFRSIGIDKPNVAAISDVAQATVYPHMIQMACIPRPRRANSEIIRL